MSVGETLRRRREELKLTLEDVYNISRIRPIFIEALEEEDWERFPSPSQARAFLRKYIKVLGLPEVLLDQYEGLIPAGYPQFTPVKKLDRLKAKGSSKPITFSVILALFLLLLFGAWRYGFLPPISLPNKLEGKGPKETVTAPNPTTSPQKAEGSTQIEIRGETKEAKEEPPKQEGKSPPRVEEHRLILVCHERSWVRVYIDQEPVKDYLFNPGDRYEWVAKEGFEIKIGNAAGVELEYNGKAVGSLGKKGQVVLLRFPEVFQRRVNY